MSAFDPKQTLNRLLRYGTDSLEGQSALSPVERPARRPSLDNPRTGGTIPEQVCRM